MKQWIARAVVLAVSLSVFGMATPGYAAAGHTAGSFAVAMSGDATYTLPIGAPPGPNHLQPAIALTYDSAVGNGPAGVGWSISGLSAISRCNRTVAQDSAASGVNLATSDALCLDGQRLQLTGGTQGHAGSTYQTEIANFENVTAYGSAGNGPGYFIVQAPNGTQYEYGNPNTTPSAQVLATGTTTASAWMLDKVTDSAGNTMLITYTTATGTAVPNTISWTPIASGSSTYQYAMQFTYGANVPQSSVYGYVAGTSVTDTQLLQSIAVTYTPSGSGTSTVKQYNLGYSTSAVTLRKELTSVTECADSTTGNCLSPTNFTYQNATFGISTTATTAVTLPAFSARPVLNYDFNGDGIPDILYNNGTSWYVAFGTPSGYTAGVNTGIATSKVISQNIVVGDVLGTHHDGILAQNGTYWYYYTCSTSGCSNASTGLFVDASAANFALVDVSGDGKPDFVSGYSYVSGSNPAHLTTRLNTSSGGTVSFGSPVTAFTDPSGGTTNAMYSPDSFTGGLRSWDFNGDGRQDLFFYGFKTVCSPTCTVTIIAYELLGQSNGTFSAASLPFTYTASYTANTLQFLNWNNDKCTDITWATQVFVSSCSGTIGSTLNLAGTLVTAIDVDGDGRKDAIINNGGTLAVQTSTGVNVSYPPITLGISYDSSAYYGHLDVGGVGLDALEIYSTVHGNVNYYARNSPGTVPDVLTSATDGFGNSATPTYFSITQGTGNHYSVTSNTPPESTDAAFASPLYIVGSVTFSDPSATGATYTQSHYYTNAWQNLQGRGFLGFTTHQRIDSRNAVAETQTFNMVFPTTGLVVGDVAVQSSGSGSTISNLTATPAATTLYSGAGAQRYFPYIANLSRNQYEVGGTKNGQLITTSATTYSFDNYGNPTQVSSTVTDEDYAAPQSPYYGRTWTTVTANTPDEDTSHWCLILNSQTQVAHSASDGSTAVTQVSQFTPDTTHCRYTQVIRSTSGGSSSVTEALGYDSFGNINSDSVTGSGGMTARTTSVNWGTSATTGQFPLSVTDPSGATTQIGYDYRYGLPNSITDPNGLITNETYGDGFARKTLEKRPDGTSTTYAYSDCSSSGCLIGGHGLVVNYSVLNADQSVQSSGSSYLDSVDRPLVQTSPTLSATARNEVRYNSLGKIAQRAAPCTWNNLATACTYWSTAYYDALSRLTELQRPISASNPTLQTTGYQYLGRSTAVTDPQGKVTTTIVDVNGWLRQTQDAIGYAVTSGYDAAGNKVAVTDSLSNTLWTGTYTYGAGAFLSGATDMDLGAWSYTVDALGEATGWHDANGKNFSMAFDALGRPTSRTEPDLYTNWTWGASSANHNYGQLVSECTGTGPGSSTPCNGTQYSEARSFDATGRLSTRAITLPNGTFTYGWTYDGNSGLLSKLTYPTSTSGYAFALGYGYSQGILNQVKDVSDSPNVTVWQANATNSGRQVTQETLGNGIVTNRAFDAVTGWLASIQSGVGSGAGLQNQSFLYDMMGNVTQRQDGNQGLTENAFYDADYRLTSTQLNSTQNLAVTYDAMGNITSRSDIGSGTAWSYDPTHKHQVTSIAGVGLVYSYDSNGNVTSRSGGTITMASYNYPTSISVVSPVGSETVALTYGPDRARWQQQYSSVNFGNPATTNYIGGLMEQVISGGVTTYRHYIYAGGEPVAIYARTSSGTNTFNYFLSDHQGSVAAITASNGTLVVAESNTPFGERRAPSTWVDPAITSTGWTGQVSDADIIASTAVTQQGYTFQTMLGMFMGLNHMNGRVQDAITGRFLSADPNIPDPTDTQDYNRYSYVRNNPLTLVDPSGFDASNNCSTDADGNTTCNVTANRYVPAGPGLNGANLWLPDPQEILFLNLAFAAIQKALEELQKPCGVPQQIGGTIQNAAAAAINGKTISFGFDQVASNGSEIRYSNSSFAVNTYGQFIRSYGDSTAMDGVVFGYMVGVGPGVYQNFSGPVQSSTGTSYVAVGGVAVAAEGAVVALSVDADSAGGSAPPVVPHLDYTIGFGAGAAHGSVSTTTIATLPRIPSIPTSTCHL